MSTDSQVPFYIFSTTDGLIPVNTNYYDNETVFNLIKDGKKDIGLFQNEVTLYPGDVLAIGSDGVFGNYHRRILDEPFLENILSMPVSPRIISDILVNRAQTIGENISQPDAATALVFQVPK